MDSNYKRTDERRPRQPQIHRADCREGEGEGKKQQLLLRLTMHEQILSVAGVSRSQAAELFNSSPSSLLLGVFHIQKEHSLSSKTLHLIKPG